MSFHFFIFKKLYGICHTARIISDHIVDFHSSRTGWCVEDFQLKLKKLGENMYRAITQPPHNCNHLFSMSSNGQIYLINVDASCTVSSPHTHCSRSFQLHHCIAIKPPIIETVFITVIVAKRCTQSSFKIVKETASYLVVNYNGGDHGNTSTTRSQRQVTNKHLTTTSQRNKHKNTSNDGRFVHVKRELNVCALCFGIVVVLMMHRTRAFRIFISVA